MVLIPASGTQAGGWGARLKGLELRLGRLGMQEGLGSIPGGVWSESHRNMCSPTLGFWILMTPKPERSCSELAPNPSWLIAPREGRRAGKGPCPGHMPAAEPALTDT